MKHSFTSLYLCLLCTILVGPGCLGGKKTTTDPQPAATVNPDQGPQASTRTYQVPEIAPPAGTETLYIADLRDSGGRQLGGIRCMILGQEPEPLYMREPRRKSVGHEGKTPRHGRYAAKIGSDNKPKFLWIGGPGVEPQVHPLQAAAPGQTHQKTYSIQTMPFFTMQVLDHQGFLVNGATVTLKSSKEASNYGMTERADDAGEIVFTRRPGKMYMIATKGNGTCRLEQEFTWDGKTSPMQIKLPERSPGK